MSSQFAIQTRYATNYTVWNIYMWMQQQYDISDRDIFMFPTVDVCQTR